MRDPASRPQAGSNPWSLEGDYSSVLYVKNTATKPSSFVADIFYSGGSYMIGMKILEAGETAAIDIRKLRDEQIADVNGHRLPPGITAGQINWMTRNGNPRLIGRVNMMSISKGLASNMSCHTCPCSCPSDVSVSLQPGSWAGAVGSTFSFTPWETDSNNCGSQSYPIPASSLTWSSANPAVASVDQSAVVSCHAGGSTTVSGDGFFSTQVIDNSLDPANGCFFCTGNSTEQNPAAPVTVQVSISCDTVDLGYGPDPNFGSFAENGVCNTKVGNPGGTYMFVANLSTISIKNNNDGTASYSSSSPSQKKQDTQITVTYTDPTTGGNVSATFSGITVHKPTSLSTNSTTPNDHTIACTLPCLANPNTGSCVVKTGTSCSYQEPITRRVYSILDQFGQAFENVNLSSAGTVTEQVTAQQGTCSGNQVETAPTGGSPFHDDFGKCDSCCEPGGPGCQSTAQQTIFVNGFAVRSENITVTCTQATLVP